MCVVNMISRSRDTKRRVYIGRLNANIGAGSLGIKHPVYTYRQRTPPQHLPHGISAGCRCKSVATGTTALQF